MPKGHKETLQLLFIPQVLAWYIQYQHIYSTNIYFLKYNCNLYNIPKYMYFFPQVLAWYILDISLIYPWCILDILDILEKSGGELWKCMKTNIYICRMFLDRTGPSTKHGCLNIWELMVLWSLAHVSFNLWFQCLVFVLQVPHIQCSTSYSVWFVTLYNAI